MKKLVMAAVIVACAASMVSAQVYSANIVGYNKDVGTTGLHISGYAFSSMDTSPQGVFGDQLPLGTKLYAFTGAGYDISEYSSVFDYNTYTYVDAWDPNTLDLGGATGFWVELQSDATAILSGEVEMADAVTNSLAVGLQLLSNPYPVSSQVKDMGFDPTIGDKIYAFTGSGYDISEYSSVFDYNTYTYVDAWDPALTIDVGEGFWYEATAEQTWVANRPFTP
jgi:hypothetical protein